MASVSSQASPQDQEKSPGLNLGFFKALSDKNKTRDGNPAKRRGPKPDSKPALTRRQELNRQAQRTHRERKELYIKALEDEVLRLKDMFGNVSLEKDKLAEENKQLKASMAQHGLPFTSPGHFDDSLSPSSAAHAASLSGSSNYGTGASNAFTPPLTTQSTAPSVSSTQHQPMSANQFRAATATNRGTDLEQAGIDFVLTLEKPCMAHAPWLIERAKDADGEPCGHVLMASFPPIISSDPMENTVPCPREPEPAWGQLNKAELSVLMELSKQLNLDGEITPVMAWGMVQNHPRFDELDGADFQRLGEELLSKVRCYGFGAVMENFEVLDAIEGTLSSHPEQMIY